jgi:hypothetical protein
LPRRLGVRFGKTRHGDDRKKKINKGKWLALFY